MSIFTFLKNVNNKMRELDKKATNPFLNLSLKYNPYKSTFSQTYVWIEEESKKNKE